MKNKKKKKIKNKKETQKKKKKHKIKNKENKMNSNISIVCFEITEATPISFHKYIYDKFQINKMHPHKEMNMCFEKTCEKMFTLEKLRRCMTCQNNYCVNCCKELFEEQIKNCNNCNELNLEHVGPLPNTELLFLPTPDEKENTFDPYDKLYPVHKKIEIPISLCDLMT